MLSSGSAAADLGGTPPHLDVVLEGPGGVLAIESKLTEYLTPKEPKFAESYFANIKDKRQNSTWYAEMQRIAKISDYRFLDAAQLIKHYFGLARTFADKPVTRLYLYWEPVNASEIKPSASIVMRLLCLAPMSVLQT